MTIPEEKNDNERIMTEAVHDFKKGLVQRVLFKIQNRALGEDLIQDTFMKTWKYLVKGGRIDTMKAFLYHILNNLIIDEYRKKKTVSLETLVEKGFEPKAPDAERQINTLDGKAAVLLISRLPEIYQKVLKMKYIQGLSIKEIALLTGQTKNAITVKIHRGLEKLKFLYRGV